MEQDPRKPNGPTGPSDATETDSRPGAEERPADVHEGIRTWLEIRCQSPRRKPAIRLYGYLRQPSPYWPFMADRFREALIARFDGVVRLARVIGEEPASARPPRLSEWLECAAPIAAFWDEPASWNLSVMLIELAEDDNPLGLACVSQSLAASVTSQPALAVLEPPSQELASLDLEFWGELPLPPAEGCSLRADDYLMPAMSGELIRHMDEACEQWNTLAEQLGEVCRELPGFLPPFRADESCVSAQQKLQGTMRLAARGWPVDMHRVVDCWRTLGSRLCLASSAPAESVGPDAARAGGLAREMAELQAGLFSKLPDRWTASCGFGPPQAASETKVPLNEGLNRLVQSLNQEHDAAAHEFARRLRDASTPGESPDDRSASLRKALSCLIQLDELVAAQTATISAWPHEARQRLRGLLLAGGELTLLEEQLVGRPIETCRAIAEPIGFVDRPGISRQIVLVQQPGYSLRLTDGTQRVLRPAKVFLVR